MDTFRYIIGPSKSDLRTPKDDCGGVPRALVETQGHFESLQASIVV